MVGVALKDYISATAAVLWLLAKTICWTNPNNFGLVSMSN